MLKAAAGGEIINGGKMSSPLSFDEITLVRPYRQRGGRGGVTSAVIYRTHCFVIFVICLQS